MNEVRDRVASAIARVSDAKAADEVLAEIGIDHIIAKTATLTDHDNEALANLVYHALQPNDGRPLLHLTQGSAMWKQCMAQINALTIGLEERGFQIVRRESPTVGDRPD